MVLRLWFCGLFKSGFSLWCFCCLLVVFRFCLGCVDLLGGTCNLVWLFVFGFVICWFVLLTGSVLGDLDLFFLVVDGLVGVWIDLFLFGCVFVVCDIWFGFKFVSLVV